MTRPDDWRTAQTITPARFAELTGVSRERLRTWERRHGFPRPVRSGNGPRRYAASDAPRVIAVREAAESGVPVARAIKLARRMQAPASTVLAAALAESVVNFLPLPLAIVSGPEPLRIEYVNDAAAAASGARPGALLLEIAPALVGTEMHRSLLTLFASGTAAVEREHPPWSGPSEGLQRSLLFRLPPSAGPPLCAIVSIDAERERREREELTLLVADHAREQQAAGLRGDLLRSAAHVTERLRSDDGSGVLRAATAAVKDRLGAIDAGLALYMAGELVLGTSTAGTLGPSMVLVAAHEQLGGVLRGGRPAWLDPETGRAFGAPARSACLAAPVIVAGETVGMLLVVFGKRVEVSADANRFIEIVLGPVGFALIRDRFLETSRAS